jgi:hypothetical protein
MQHDIVIQATKYLKFNVEAPTLQEAQTCALNAAKQHFRIVEIVDVRDAEFHDVPLLPVINTEADPVEGVPIAEDTI